MSIDYTSIYASLYNRVATSGDGSAIRALVGQGSVSSIFPRKDLNRLAGRTLPYLVWTPGAVAGQSGAMRDIGASWWIYNGTESAPLFDIAGALEALYGSPGHFAIDFGGLQVTFIGQPRFDDGLALYGLEVRIGYRRLI